MISDRKLAAILFADIQGYTSLMQEDEQLGATLLHKFQESLQARVAEEEGEIVNFYGDGCLCIFGTPLQAVQCAISLQGDFAEEPRVPVRIGIHSGTIVREGEKVYGHSVNFASRIESLGAPGSILFSKKVRDDIRNHRKFQIESLGVFDLKNLDEPVSIYALANPGLIVPSRKGRTTRHGYLRSPSTRGVLVVGVMLVVIFGLFQILPLKNGLLGSGSSDNDNLTQIAIEVFEDHTMQDGFDIVGKMAADWITHGIVENQIAPVISYKTIDSYSGISKAGLGARQILRLFSDSIKLIKGTYYVADSNLIFQCSVVEHGSDRPLHAFENITCHVDHPLEGIKRLKDDILGYWVTREKGHIAPEAPSFSAYECYLKAKDVWAKDYVAADSLLVKSISIDPDFMHAKILMAHLYYNTGKYQMLDSLLNRLEEDVDVRNPVQANIIIYLRALLEGNNKLILETYKKEYATAPKDLFKNTAMMVIATNYVRQPNFAMEVFKALNDDDFDYANCSYCMVRLEAMAVALLLLGKDEQVIDLLEPVVGQTDRRTPRYYLVKAYMRAGHYSELDEMLRETASNPIGINPNYLYFLTAHEAQLLN
ncbi:MAG: adenylate/guanylate cyclase domain-containing protein, partial [Saprospiraceae bacterium]|nr:adenylate/guanylate cyclase domain-containing protein [Saprospiraceae bacterium]